MAASDDYVLGTGDEEIERLGLQHVVWRAYALDAWQRAGFNVGQTLLDVGCGPGHAALDLAQLVGPRGRVLALERSAHFLSALQSTRAARGLEQLTALQLDLEQDDFPQMEADGAWCRWVLCFLKRPRRLLDRIATALRPGGVLVLHEYFNYGTWRLIPASAEFEEFVGLVMQSWRDEGGEPDIGLKLPIWLAESGFTVQAVQPIIDVFPPTNLTWQWPKTFFQAGLRRLLQTRHLDEVRARQMADAFARCEATPHALMISPAVLEIIAVRRN